MMDVYTSVQHLSCMMFNCKNSVIILWVVLKIDLILVKIYVRGWVKKVWERLERWQWPYVHEKLHQRDHDKSEKN